MVLLEAKYAFQPRPVIKAFERQFPASNGQFRLSEAASASGPLQNASLFRLGDQLLTVFVVPAPVPAGTLDRALAADRIWPEARSTLARHRAHAIVASMAQASGFQASRAAADAVTRLAAAVASASPALGVYWAEGDTISSVPAFQAAAQKLGEGVVPVEAWVQLWWLDGPPQNGQRTLAVVTTGLRPFIGREIEVAPAPLPPLVIGQRLFGAITYLLAHGPVLSDGDTIGVSETERIRARFRDRGQRPGVPVIELSFEQLDASGAPAGPLPQSAVRPSAIPQPSSAPRPFGKRGR